MRKQMWRVLLMVVLTGAIPGLVSAGNSPLETARTQFEQRQFEKAIDTLESAIKTNGESADLLVLMADIYLAMGSERKAEKIYRQALELEPGHVDGNLNLAMLLVNIRERREAIARINMILDRYPNHARAHFCLGMAYHARADINDAFSQYKILKKIDKDLAEELYDVIFSR